VSIIALNRRFIEWNDKELPDPEIRDAFGLSEGGLGWDELLQKRRVVILAEAGSGKTTEMQERARITAANGSFSFFVAVEDVGRDGLERALSARDHQALCTWHISTGDAWFFVDSVDEAKSRGIRLERVVRRLADGIAGAEQRAHIILSGRISDWEFRKDLMSLKTWLPVSSKVSKPEGTGEEELLRIIRQQRRPDEAPPALETPFVAGLAPLDRKRVRLFAQGKSAQNLDQFLETIEAANLWHFARRPLDLDWLVRFWQSEGRLGSLAEMVERSTTERLKETNTDRARGDTLDSAAARHAVERVGAAMVFGRRETIAIPDAEVTLTSDSALQLCEILPDWSPGNRSLLLSRPIFDPATLGRARFHNDNEGVVRGYLTARWLSRLRSANLPTRALFDLLFAKSYGLEVIRPSEMETVAWLSLWDRDVANEAIRRRPLLLFESGDPASLSPRVRRDALVALVGVLAKGDHELPLLDNSKLRRFAQYDLGSVVTALWPQYRTNNEAAELMLRLVWLGALKECAQLAYDAAFDKTLEPTARIFAARALLATGDEAARKRYAELAKAEKATLPPGMVRYTIGDLFPGVIGVQDLLEILATDNPTRDGGLGFELEGPVLVKKLDDASEIEELLRGLLTLISGELREHSHYPPTKQEEAYFPAIAEATLHLLQLSPPDTAPEIAIDALLLICNRRHLAAPLRNTTEAALTEVHRTSARRRTAFWRAAQSFRSSEHVQSKIDQLWQLGFFGYAHGLQIEDVDWLLTDGLTKEENDRRLAVNSALTLYRSAGEPAGMLEKISSAVRSDPVASEVYRELTEAQEPSPEFQQMERESQRIDRLNQVAQAKRDQSWIDFIRQLQNDPQRVAKIRDPPSSGVNPDLLNLWRLVEASSGQSRWAINSVTPLERIAGTEIAAAVEAGLIAHWRASSPVLRSQRTDDERNMFGEIQLMGLAGVTLEAAKISGWAKRLSSTEATQAAGYATLELNGFPRWMPELVEARTGEVRAVLLAEIIDEIGRLKLPHRDTLQNVAYADPEIATLLAPRLLDELENRILLPGGALLLLLRIIVKGITPDQKHRFVKLGIERFEKEPDASTAVQYLAAAFSLDPKAATDVLARKVAGQNPGDQAELVDRFLSASFGDSMVGPMVESTEISSDVLVDIVRLSFQTHAQVAGRSRPAGIVYKMDANDFADRARSAVFDHLVKTPGRATYEALLRFQADPACPVPATRLRWLAEERAILDSESAPWIPSEAFEFEQHHETAPRTGKDLQSVLISRLEDIQHELVHGDFAQGLTLKALPHEVDVQNWVADRLRLKQGRAFSVEREPHVAGEKEPDIRIRAKATDASAAMEIKVAEMWTLKQLDEALEAQLCGRYLRASEGRYGVLLLVHQQGRPKGWEDSVTGKYLSFAEIFARLSARAAAISAAYHDSPQPEVCVLDVSDL